MLLWEPFAIQAAARYFERGSLETGRSLWWELRLPTNGEMNKSCHLFWSNFPSFILPELMEEERSDSDALSVTQPPAPPWWVAPWLPSSSPSPSGGCRLTPARHHLPCLPRRPRWIPCQNRQGVPAPRMPGSIGCVPALLLSPCGRVPVTVWSAPPHSLYVTSLTFLRGQRLRCLFPRSKEDPGIHASLQVQMFTVSAQRARFSDICS